MTGRLVSRLALLATLPILVTGPIIVPVTEWATGAASRAASGAATGVVARAAEEEPLQVNISSMPTVIPPNGPIRVTGTVTNVSDEAWSLINVYAFVSGSPITNAAALELAAETDPLQPTGDRIVSDDPATFDLIEKLPPGASRPYTLTVPSDLLTAQILGSPGVYWFGIQALGENAEGRDTIADGRARSFLPLLGPAPDPVTAALVVPIRREVVHRRNGSLRGVRLWARDLGPDGRLRNLLDFAAGAPAGAITWLIDPAVLEAVQRIADDNPPRDLGPVSDGAPEPSETPDEDAAEEVSAGAGSGSTLARDSAGRWATEWLGRLTLLTQSGRVLGLPYGDVDMAAANTLDPHIATRALALSAASFNDFGIRADPVVAPPSGYLDPASVPALDVGVSILASDAVLAEEKPAPDGEPTTVTVAGHDIDLYDDAASSGGPGPTPSEVELAIRQRLVSEAALRTIGQDAPPLVVALPFDWNPGSHRAGFFAGLDLPWLSLVPQQFVTQPDPPTVAADTLVYPDRQNNRELTSANFTAADRLTSIGTTLQNVLTRNTTVEREVAVQALTSTSYFKRADPTGAARDAEAARRSIQSSLSEVRISAPPYVTLSSATGRFRVDLENDLDQEVTVQIQALVDADLEIRAPSPIRLEGRSSRSVLLQVQSTQLGIHQVRLALTDVDGRQFGPHADLPVRANQSGRIIWVIIGAGLVLLFGAIGLRLFRRITGRAAHGDQR